jgi:hypothetical protein
MDYFAADVANVNPGDDLAPLGQTTSVALR